MLSNQIMEIIILKDEFLKLKVTLHKKLMKQLDQLISVLIMQEKLKVKKNYIILFGEEP